MLFDVNLLCCYRLCRLAIGDQLTSIRFDWRLPVVLGLGWEQRYKMVLVAQRPEQNIVVDQLTNARRTPRRTIRGSRDDALPSSRPCPPPVQVDQPPNVLARNLPFVSSSRSVWAGYFFQTHHLCVWDYVL